MIGLEAIATQIARRITRDGYASYDWIKSVVLTEVRAHVTAERATHCDCAALLTAAAELKQDLIERAAWDKAVRVRGKSPFDQLTGNRNTAEAVVCAGNGVWARFCDALEGKKAPTTNGGVT